MARPELQSLLRALLIVAWCCFGISVVGVVFLAIGAATGGLPWSVPAISALVCVLLLLANLRATRRVRHL